MKKLSKEEALFEIGDFKMDECFISINITHRFNRGNYYGAWFDFQSDLDELGIVEYMDEWVVDIEKFPKTESLKYELEKRGFNVN